MPRKREPIPDSLLISNGVYDLNPLTKLSERQVELMTTLGMDALKERRRMKPPKPPFPFKSDDDKKGSAIWYPLGEVLAYMNGLLPRPLPTSSPAQGSASRIQTFAELMAVGRPEDEWAFTRMRGGAAVDFFAGLRLGDMLEVDAECLWMTLDTYLLESIEWSHAQRAAASQRSLSELPVTDSEWPACPRCGKPQVPGHSHM